MAQQLIVEGKDGYVVAQICLKRNIAAPKGYDKKGKIKEFFKNAEGITKVNFALKEALDNPDIKNIGVITDANDAGPQARFESLKAVIETKLNIAIPETAQLTDEGFCYEINEGLKIGIWVMPDNINNGYLEHFAGSLIDPMNETWQFANNKIEEISKEPFCEFTPAKKQKALLHGYLALKENPGLPMGLGIAANYLNADSPNADKFVVWLQNCFEFQ